MSIKRTVSLVRGVRIMAVTALVACLPAISFACPTCKDAMSDDPVAGALSLTTLLLIGLPFSLIGGIGGWIALANLRAARQDEALASGATGDPILYPVLKEGE